MECDDNSFYDENCNFLFVKTESDGKKLSDYIYIHKDIESDKGFLAHFKSYKEDTPMEVYSLKRIPIIDIEHEDHFLSQTGFSEDNIWKRIRINGFLPSKWRMLFDKIMSNRE